MEKEAESLHYADMVVNCFTQPQNYNLLLSFTNNNVEKILKYAAIKPPEH